MKVGYIRVSTVEQNVARQKEILEQQKVEKFFEEKVSGKNTNRPQLREMLDYVREGDTIVITSLDRLGRNTKDLLEILELLESKKVTLYSVKEVIDTSTPIGKFIVTMLAAVAEMERETILERQKAGILIAKKEGKYRGRSRKIPKNFDKYYKEWVDGKLTATKAAKLLDISKPTFYKLAKEKQVS